MYVLSLKDWKVAHLRRTLTCFANTRTLARGTFSAVFETPDPTRVLKLTTDPTHYSYLTDGISPDGPHKPVVLHDYGEVGETSDELPLYLVELERLQKVRAGTENGLLPRRIVRHANKDPDRRYPDDPDHVPGMPPSLVRFLDDLNHFIFNLAYTPDVHGGNFMERADGTLVVNDPVFDNKLLLRTSRERYRQKQESRGYAYGY
jgi:hypothetical protein